MVPVSRQVSLNRNIGTLRGGCGVVFDVDGFAWFVGYSLIVGAIADINIHIVEVGVNHSDPISSLLNHIVLPFNGTGRNKEASISWFCEEDELLEITLGKVLFDLLVVDDVKSTEPILDIVKSRSHGVVVVEKHSWNLNIWSFNHLCQFY